MKAGVFMFTQITQEELSQFPNLKVPVAGEVLTTFEGLQRLIMLDRYSRKDTTLNTLKNGDTVIVTIQAATKYPLVGYGVVTTNNPIDKTVAIKLEYPTSISTDENPDYLVRSYSDISKPVELYWEQISYRVAKAIADQEETPELQEIWHERFNWLLHNQYLVPGGRILYGAGNSSDATLFNCYVLPSPPDSRQGITHHASKIVEVMARGGGVGTNISSLRPRDAIVVGINGFSSGSISWANWFAQLTHMIKQSGTRNGAQMISQADWHPDIVEFSLCKIQNPNVLDKISQEVSDPYIRSIAERFLKRDTNGNPVGVHDKNFMTGANISVLVSDDFMEAVATESEWELRYIDLQNLTSEQKQIYDLEWHSNPDIRIWENKGFPIKTYHSINAKDLYHLFMICARYSAEPGMIFIDQYNNESNSYYYAPIICTNPCGEQGLPAWGVCNLAAVNLDAMYDPTTKDIDWQLFEKVIHYSQRFCDNITDANSYFFKENELQAKKERRVGKGWFGLADLMIRLELPYGSHQMIEKTEELIKFFTKHSYLASANIAAEKGSFEAFETDKFLQSGFMERLVAEYPEVEIAIREKGCRNVTSITMAPVGSTGTMMGKSTGIEPFFAFEYYRTSRFGEFTKVYTSIAQEYFDANPEAKELPAHFISAMQLTAEEHVLVQAVIQKWVDSSLSKTANAPKTFTVKDTEQLYMMAYNTGCKGVTVYVDGSRDEQVLTLEKEPEPAKELDVQDSTKICTITFDEAGNRNIECTT
ncbi:Ribonucleoside-diphosphate reductase NrdZ [compost metagenome]